MQVPKNAHVEKACAKANNGHRYTMQHAPWLERGHLYATDGRIAVRVYVDVTEGDTDGDVPVAALKAARKHPVGEIILDERATIGDVSALRTPPDEFHPIDVDCVIPASDSTLQTISIDASLLHKLSQALGTKEVRIEIPTEKNTPLRVVPIGEGAPADSVGALMPMARDEEDTNG